MKKKGIKDNYLCSTLDLCVDNGSMISEASMERTDSRYPREIEYWTCFLEHLWGMCVCDQSCLTPVNLWTVACQASLSLEFSRQEYWSGLPFLSPGDLPDSGVDRTSPSLADGFVTTQPPGKPTNSYTCRQMASLKKLYRSPLVYDAFSKWLS